MQPSDFAKPADQDSDEGGEEAAAAEATSSRHGAVVQDLSQDHATREQTNLF